MAKKTSPLFAQFDSAFQHLDTGEMWVPRSDGAPGLVPTGYNFERVTQGQPSVRDLQGPRSLIIRITPWAFATQVSATRLMLNLREFVPASVELTLQAGDDNTQFPFSHTMWQIRGKQGQYKARINAGLLASNVARTTATLDGQVRQFPERALEAAALELQNELQRLANPPDFSAESDAFELLIAGPKYIMRAMPRSLVEYAALCGRAA